MGKKENVKPVRTRTLSKAKRKVQRDCEPARAAQSEPNIVGESGELFTGKLVKSRRIIYTPSDFAKSNLTYLQEVGTLTALQPHASGRFDLPSYLFFIVLSGSGVLRYDKVEYPISSGECAFINCRIPYQHLSSQNLWTLKWVHFHGPTMEGIYEKYVERGGRPVFRIPTNRSEFNFESLSNLVDSIYSIAKGSSHLRDMEIYEKLTTLLFWLMQWSWSDEDNDSEESGLTTPQGSPSKRQHLKSVKEYLSANFSQKIRLDFLARQFGVNKFYLTHLFKKDYGMTIQAYLLQVRITRAKHYLRFTDWSIEKVASEVGYQEVNFFIRMFKKTEGITPGIYRHKWQGAAPLK